MDPSQSVKFLFTCAIGGTNKEALSLRPCFVIRSRHYTMRAYRGRQMTSAMSRHKHLVTQSKYIDRILITQMIPLSTIPGLFFVFSLA